MEQIKHLLASRESYLQKLKSEKEKALKIAPAGCLRICARDGKTYYYHRKDPKNFNGTYIRQKDRLLATQLAQKDYNTRVLTSTNQELLAIKNYLSSVPKEYVEDIYTNLNPYRQELVHPILEPEHKFIQNWLAVEYQGKYFDETTPELYTSKGERVRSKSEIIIADLLDRHSIPYRYEYPLSLSGFGKVYPDFTVLNVRLRKEFYWEHFGMMDDPFYAEKAVQKIMTYEQNGIFPGENLILTYETKQTPVKQKIVQLFIQKYLL